MRKKEMIKRWIYGIVGSLVLCVGTVSAQRSLSLEECREMALENNAKMKDGVILVNTSRGGLIKTDDLIQGIRDGKFFAVGLDVYEEETGFVYEDMSDQILDRSTMARLLSFPNVMVTSHQGFFTKEALEAISHTTLENVITFAEGKESPNTL